MATQNPEVNSRPFFLAIPETVARHAELTPAAKCVAGSIYTRTHGRNIRPGSFVLIRADWIAAEWSMSHDTVTDGIRQLVAAGIVERNRTRAGNVLRWNSYEIPEIPDSGNSGIKIPEIPGSKNRDPGNSGMTAQDPGKTGMTSRKNRDPDPGNSGIKNPEIPGCTLIPVPRPVLRPEPQSARAPDAGTRTRDPEPDPKPGPVQAAGLEPHESGLATRLPEPDRKPDLPATVRYLADRISPAAAQWAWQMVAVRGIDPNDWRLVETLRKVHGSGKRPNGYTYFDPIFQDLPPERPKRADEYTAEDREKIIAGMIERAKAKEAAQSKRPLSGLA